MVSKYNFPAVRGIQAGTEYYIAMIQLKMLPELFPGDDASCIPPEYRAQRKLNEARIPAISRYILDNRSSYVFSALAASIDGNFTFRLFDNNSEIGILCIDENARFLINDGQHSKQAILEALKEDPTLEKESISIVLYTDKGLARSQQIFTDLNKNARKTSNSISKLYDSRDEMAVVTRNVIESIEFLNKYTDKENDNLGKYSSNLFTLNTFYTANKTIVGRKWNQDCEKFLVEFWSLVVQRMKQWQELQDKEITKVDLRENFIVTQGIVIQAIGRVGKYFYQNNKVDMSKMLERMNDIDWSRNASIWKMRAVGKNGRIITNKRAALLIANEIKKQIGIELSSEETSAEKSLKEIL